MSRLGLGMMSYGDPGRQSWALQENRAEPVVRRAVGAGITLFDTARHCCHKVPWPAACSRARVNATAGG